jgi:hypothetical protein
VFNIKYSSVFCVNKSSHSAQHKVFLRIWEDLFTQNTEKYTVCWTLGRFIYTKYWGILYVEHCEKIYLHKILRNTVCWAPWEDLFTQNTEEYFMLSTVGRFIVLNIKYSSVFCVNKSSHSVQHTVFLTVGRFIYTKYWEIYCMLNTVGRFIYTKYWGILYVEHCEKIYLHKILTVFLSILCK